MNTGSAILEVPNSLTESHFFLCSLFGVWWKTGLQQWMCSALMWLLIFSWIHNPEYPTTTSELGLLSLLPFPIYSHQFHSWIKQKFLMESINYCDSFILWLICFYLLTLYCGSLIRWFVYVVMICYWDSLEFACFHIVIQLFLLKPFRGGRLD